jgi:tetratricopeptide (TPR) repeat protein
MERAFGESKDLSREQRTLIEARYRELNKEWDQALHLYRSLFTFFPDSLEYGLYLANAQLGAGQIPPALSTINQLRRLPAPDSEDPRINIAEARAAATKGDYDVALALLEASVRQGESMAAPLLTATARLELSFIYETLGRHSEALESSRQAQRVYAAAGDRAALADALLLEGTTHSFLGELGAASKAYNEALSNLLDIENNALVATLMGNLAIVLAKQGKLELALARAEAGLTWGRELDSKDSAGAAEIAIGWIATLRGDLPMAEKHFKKAEIIFNELADPRLMAWARFHKGQLFAARGQLDAAREELNVSLSIREEHGLDGFAAESRAALAELKLELGEAAAAADLARHAADQFRRDGQAESEALARALLGQALMAIGKKEEARYALARAAELRGSTQNALVRVQVSRILGEIRGGSDDRAELARAKIDLGAALEEAQAIGVVQEVLRVELALARIQQKSGEEEGARSRLDKLVEAASRRGFTRIAAAATEISGSIKNPAHD